MIFNLILLKYLLICNFYNVYSYSLLFNNDDIDRETIVNKGKKQQKTLIKVLINKINKPLEKE